MTSSPVVVAVAALYLAICVLLGIVSGRRASATADGFVAGDRTLGPLVMYFITGATIFSAFAFLGGPGWAYSRGASALYILGYGTLGFVPFYFLGPRAARVGRAYGFVTQAEMAAERFSSRSLGGVMALVSIVALVPYLALQIKGAGLVLEAVTRGAVPQALGGAVIYAVVLFYVLRSGVLGVGWTNVFQGLLMMGLAWGLGLWLPWRLYGGIGPMFERIALERPELLSAPGLAGSGAPWSWGEYSAAVLVSIAGFSVWPHLFMKAFTARDEATIRRTVVLYPTFQIFLVPLFLIGYCGVFFEPRPPEADQILPFMLMHLELPAIVVGLFCAGALAASMSSGDAMAHAAASIAVRDGLVSALGVKLDPHAQAVWIRVGVVLALAAAYAIAVLYRGSLVMLLLTSYGAVVQFAPVIAAAFYVPRADARAVLAGLGTGSAVTVLFVVRPDWMPWPLHSGLYGLAANLAVAGLLTLAAPRDPGPRARAFVAAARGGGR